jgi:hypothetical protein
MSRYRSSAAATAAPTCGNTVLSLPRPRLPLPPKPALTMGGRLSGSR